MKITPTVQRVSIILVGNFNPTIFSPVWLEKHGAIPPQSAEAWEIQFVHPEVALFKSSWCSLQVDRDRFALVSDQSPFVRASDLAAKIFGELLPHTPMRGLGINLSVTVRAPSPAARDKFGRRIAPPEMWGAWGEGIAKQMSDAGPGQPHGGIVSATMRQTPMDDRDVGSLNVKVDAVQNSADNLGVLFEVNDHFEISNSSTGFDYANLLLSRFEPSHTRALGVIDQLVDLIHE